MLFILLISIHWGRKRPNEFVWLKLNPSRVQTTIVIARSLIKVLFALATREDGLQTISVRVWFLFLTFLALQKNKATRRNRRQCQTVRLHRREYAPDIR